VPICVVTTVDEAKDLLQGAPSPVVVVAVHNAAADVVRCVEAFFAHTGPTTALLVVDDGGVDRRAIDILVDRAQGVRHGVVVLRHERNEGYVRSCNDALEATPGRDVVLLNSDVVVGPQWLERLTAAAGANDAIATASTLTNHGTILSVPDRNRPRPDLPRGMSVDEAATRVAAASRQLRPTIPTAVGHCVYLRRAVIDLIGGFDETFSPGYGEEVDFSQRAVIHGFHHVCADDVLTFHRGSASFGAGTASSRQQAHEAIIRQRYPWYDDWVRCSAEDPSSALADALATARRALSGLRLGIDARCLGHERMGTQHVVVETVGALAGRDGIERLVVFAPATLPGYARHLADLPGVEIVCADRHLPDPGWALDLVYRPYQVGAIDEVELLDRVAQRFVVNQLDTIAFDNPAYFASHRQWLEYRDVARLVFERAGGIAFLSEHSRRSAIDAGLLTGGTPSAVVHCGVEPGEPGEPVHPARPFGLREDDDGLVLCLGASYLHKNRHLALRLWAELRRRGSTARIVLAGPTPQHGSSLAAEAEVLLAHPELRADVVVLGAVSEAEKRWLYGHAALVLYPSTTEGFGLVPFEAAAHGVPVLASRRGSLQEVIPPGVAALDTFDVAAGADLCEKLLADQAAGEALCASLRAAGEAYTWERTATRLLALFDEALAQPGRRALVIEGEDGDPVGLAARTQRVRFNRGAAGDLERAIELIVTHRDLKQVLSPEGSRRQQIARSAINQARRYLR
jgi:glycosyltransferase involved in cell wall biosynthesis/GT2 family glycosyltransferase